MLSRQRAATSLIMKLVRRNRTTCTSEEKNVALPHSFHTEKWSAGIIRAMCTSTGEKGTPFWGCAGMTGTVLTFVCKMNLSSSTVVLFRFHAGFLSDETDESG